MKAVALSVWLFLNLGFFGMCGYIYLIWAQNWRSNSRDLYNELHHRSLYDPKDPVIFYETPVRGDVSNAETPRTIAKKNRREPCDGVMCENFSDSKVVSVKNDVLLKLRRVLHDESSVFKTDNPYHVLYRGPRGSLKGRQAGEILCRLQKAGLRTLTKDDSPFDSLPVGDLLGNGEFFKGRHFHSCAVVSNAASLEGSNSGSAIDNHDVVVRFNHAPTAGYEADVGTKTDIRIVNSQVVTKEKYGFTSEEMYRNITVVVWDPSDYAATLQQWYEKPDFDFFSEWTKHRQANPSATSVVLDPRSVWRIWDFIQSLTALRIRRNPPSSGFLGRRCEIVNTGTVLFDVVDAQKNCWTPDEQRLLLARRNFQSALPDPSRIDFEQNNPFTAIRDYFRTALETVRKNSPPAAATDHILAMADTVGGYLKFYILPTAKNAFYCGQASFEDAASVYDLYGDLKALLRTDGAKWREPEVNFLKTFPVEPLVISKDPEGIVCSGLLLTDKNSSQLVIPLPFFDSDINPQLLALPTISNRMVNISSSGSAYVLLKYYVTAMQCMTVFDANNNSSEDFNGQLYMWTMDKVVPLLQRNELYPAFGGVLRILEGMSKNGLNLNVSLPMANDSSNFLFDNATKIKLSAGEKVVNLLQGNNVHQEHHSAASHFMKNDSGNSIARSHYYVLIFFLIPVAVLVALCAIVYCCCSLHRRITAQGTKGFFSGVSKKSPEYRSQTTKLTTKSDSFLKTERKSINSSMEEWKPYPDFADFNNKKEAKGVTSSGDGFYRKSFPLPLPAAATMSFDRMAHDSSSSLIPEDIDTATEVEYTDSSMCSSLSDN